MESRERPRPAPGAPIDAIVPSRAVLTELARGFLIVNGRDPGRAAKFASTFLREHANPDRESAARPHLPAVRRGPHVWGLPNPLDAPPGP
ncbi:MAG TPA: hypothetical protein VLX64_04505 [Thermoplasmata archaeon]|nr:hypothetical protein [Thermoplasmata archaeon]HUJ78252.1 hypothetical protein [Thermoplasmata archaeon]